MSPTITALHGMPSSTTPSATGRKRDGVNLHLMVKGPGMMAAAIAIISAICLAATPLSRQTAEPNASIVNRPAIAVDARSATAGHSATKPRIEPLIFAQLRPDEARTLNGSIAFTPLGDDRPAPFRISPTSPSYALALDCLASAVFYEAGDDRVGQSAVAQVVLNRLIVSRGMV